MEGVREQGAKDDIWTYETDGNRSVKKTAAWRVSLYVLSSDIISSS